MKTWLELSAVQQADMIRSGDISAEQLLETYLAQVTLVNPSLNALAVPRFEQAREEARRVLSKAGSGSRDQYPLLGVPCSIKEAIAVKGMPHSGGLLARKDLIAEHDAPVSSRVRQAGAIPVGVTNVPELCMWVETSSPVYGRTNNAYDPGHTAGGSSGGEGALVGAGAVSFGVGSDVGGSIRLPAFFNGVFGHKPSPGLTPNTGHYPVPMGEIDRQYNVIGPLTRFAGDLHPVLQVLAGRELPAPEHVGIEGMRVLNVRGNGRQRVSGDLVRAQQSAVEALQHAGAVVEEVHIPALRYSPEIWFRLMGDAGSVPFGTMLGSGTPVNPWLEYVRWMTGRSDHTLPAITFAALEQLPLPPERFSLLGRQLQAELIERIGPRGVLLFPSYTSPAPRHHVPLLKTFHWVYTGIFNVLGFPVTQVPLGLNHKGLPLGVQVAGIPGKDDVTIAAAIVLEQKLGGWVPPSTWYSRN